MTEQVKAVLMVMDGELEAVREVYGGSPYRTLQNLLLNLVKWSTENKLGTAHVFSVVHNVDDESLVIECNTPERKRLRINIEYSDYEWCYLVSLCHECVHSGTFTEVLQADFDFVYRGSFIKAASWS